MATTASDPLSHVSQKASARAAASIRFFPAPALLTIQVEFRRVRRIVLSREWRIELGFDQLVRTVLVQGLVQLQQLSESDLAEVGRIWAEIVRNRASPAIARIGTEVGLLLAECFLCQARANAAKKDYPFLESGKLERFGTRSSRLLVYLPGNTCG